MLKAKKSLGQNFLRNTKILKKITTIAELSEEDIVVEVGPGEGALTNTLLSQAKKVYVIEKDSRAIPVLQKRFSKEISDKKLFIKEGDALEDTAESLISKTEHYKIIANIPYYITGALLRNFLETEHKPKSITLVTQKEVAERIALDPKESILSLSIKVFGAPSYGGTIKKEEFDPVPKVDSAILHVKEISTLYFEKNKITPNDFFKIIKLAFAQKRKTLIKNLSQEYPREIILQTLKDLSLDEKIRAEDISINDWGLIVKNLLF